MLALVDNHNVRVFLHYGCQPVSSLPVVNVCFTDNYYLTVPQYPMFLLYGCWLSAPARLCIMIYVLTVWRSVLFKITTSEIRELRQFHFISWPDMNVPECPALINFMNIVNSYESNDDAPPIIHCRYGQ